MNKKMNTLVNDVYTLTFGDAGENNVGMEILGSVGEVGSGFNENDLKKYKAVFEKIGCKCELVKLNDFMEESYSDEVDDAFVLVIRNGIVAFDASSECMKKEMRSLETTCVGLSPSFSRAVDCEVITLLGIFVNPYD